MQGVWNFNSETPLQRPEEFGDREFLTAEEIQQARIDREQSRAEADAKEAELNVNLKRHRLPKARVATTASGSRVLR